MQVSGLDNLRGKMLDVKKNERMRKQEIFAV